MEFDSNENHQRGASSVVLLSSIAVFIAVFAVSLYLQVGTAASDEPGPEETVATDTSPHLAAPEATKPAPNLERGRTLYQRRCANCHGADAKGKGPAARHISPRPADLTAGVYKFRSTPQGSVPTDMDIFRTLTRGVPGTAMPGWMGLSVNNRWQLVYFLKSLAPAFAGKAAAPIEIPEPAPVTEAILTRGHKLYDTLQCTKCHGNEGRGHGLSAANLKDSRGYAIYPKDFSRSSSFKNGGSARDIYRTIHTGLDGTPMASYHGMLTENDTWALVHYVRSLRVDAPTAPVIATTDADTYIARLQKAQTAIDEMKQQVAETRAAAEKAIADAAAAKAYAAALNTEQPSGAKQAAEAAASATANAAKSARDKEAKAKAAAERKKQRRALSAEARKLYRTRCAVCHGSRGRGDGPAASGLNPKPRNFTDAAWKKSTSNRKIEKAIVKGGPAVGKSPLMPANPDLATKPAIVKQLRRMVRRFK